MNVTRHKLVMAVFPNARGLAYAVFEGPLAPIDWGVAELRGNQKNRRTVARVSELFGRYQPDTVVLRDMSPDATHRISRVRRVNQAVALLAETQDISVVTYSREHVRPARSEAPRGHLCGPGVRHGLRAIPRSRGKAPDQA